MSNAMSRNKSRWKSAALAAATMAVISPLAAKAQTTAGNLSLSLSLSPIGNVVNYGTTFGASNETGGSPGTSEYIAPDQSADIYVYATITQAGNVATASTATSNIAGFQFAYFNVLQNNGSSGTTYDTTGTLANGIPVNGINTSEGSIVQVIPNSSLGLTAFGSQAGATNFSSGTYAVGDPTNMTNMAKARSASPIWSTTSSFSTNGSNPSTYTKGSGDGTNVFVDGNTVSFLLETLVYKPKFTLESPTGTLTGNGVNTLTVTVPSLGVNYEGANYFTGSSNASTGSETNSNTSVGANYTHTNYSANGVTVGGYNFSPTVSLYDAASGDANLDGHINQNDFTPVLTNYGGANNGFVNGDLLLAGSTTPSQPNVNQNDFTPILTNYGLAYGPSYVNGGGPAGIGIPTAGIGDGGSSAVPEPSSLALLSLGSLSLLRRRRKSV